MANKIHKNSMADKAIDSLVKAVKQYVNQCFNDVPFDQTRQSVIKQVVGDGSYKISLDGKESVVPCCTGQTFVVGDSVLVLIAQGNFSRKYIIGKA